MVDFPPLAANDGNPYDTSLNQIVEIVEDADFELLIDACNSLIQLDSSRPEAYAIMGFVANKMNDFGRAVQMLEAAHDLDPDCREYADALATLYTKIGKLTDGLFFAKLGVTLDSNEFIASIIPPELQNYAKALMSVGTSVYYLDALQAFEKRDYLQAIDFCQRHLQIEKDDLPTYSLLGRSQLKVGAYQQALDVLQAAVHMAPDDAGNFVALGKALIGVGKPHDALLCFQHAMQMAPADVAVYSDVMGAMCSMPDSLWPLFKNMSSAWNRKHAKLRSKKPGHKFDPAEGRRIRVGYIFGRAKLECPETNFIEAVVAAHDRRRYEIFGYQTFAREDAATHRVHNCTDNWVKLKDVDPFTASLILRNDQCDVIVDCSGYNPEGRLDALAYHAAPVQVSWISQGEGACVPGCDYLISDEILLPADEKACGKGQTPLPLEGSAFTLLPFQLVGEPGGLPALENGYITFGVQADLSAVSIECIEQWCQVLRAVPNSRLVFGYVTTLSPPVKDRIFEMVSHMGLAGRILFHESDETAELGTGLTVNRQEFFSLIDVFLDSYPVSSPLAVAQSLWMGVPVVARAMGRRSARLGASVLASAGKREWIASSDREYLKIVKTLSGDNDKLSNIRQNLREDVRKSDLFNPRSVAKRLEQTFRSILHK